VGPDAKTDFASNWVSLELAFSLSTGTDRVPETGLIEFILDTVNGHVHKEWLNNQTVIFKSGLHRNTKRPYSPTTSS
jgi:hypothetical protein